jgi:hypothetical protein
MSNLFDRTIGALHGLPDIATVKPATLRIVVPMTGDSQVFIVQTFRQREVGDTIFLETISAEGAPVRIAIPPAVSDAIARQREALTGKSRSKAAKANAQARKDRGLKPGFMNVREIVYLFNGALLDKDGESAMPIPRLFHSVEEAQKYVDGIDPEKEFNLRVVKARRVGVTLIPVSKKKGGRA